MKSSTVLLLGLGGAAGLVALLALSSSAQAAPSQPTTPPPAPPSPPPPPPQATRTPVPIPTPTPAGGAVYVMPPVGSLVSVHVAQILNKSAVLTAPMSPLSAILPPGALGPLTPIVQSLPNPLSDADLVVVRVHAIQPDGSIVGVTEDSRLGVPVPVTFPVTAIAK